MTGAVDEEVQNAGSGEPVFEQDSVVSSLIARIELRARGLRHSVVHALGARLASWRIARRGATAQELPGLVRHLELETIRRRVDALSNGHGPQIERPSDVALVRAMLLAVHGTCTASDAIASSVAVASPRVVAAVVERLVQHDRAASAWQVVSHRRELDWPIRTLAALADGLSTPDEVASFISFVESPEAPGRRATRQIAANAYVSLGRLMLDRGDMDVARTAFTQAENQRASAWTATWLSRVELASGDVVRAKEHAAAALERHRAYRPALLASVDIELARNRPDVATTVLMQVANDTRATLHELLSVWDRLDEMGAGQQALAVSSCAARRFPASVEATVRLAVSRWKSGDHGAAEALVAPVRLTFDAREIRALAFYLGHIGQSAQAYEVLSALTMLVRGAPAMVTLIQDLLRDGHQRLAGQALKRAREVFPDDADLRRLGATRLAVGDRR